MFELDMLSPASHRCRDGCTEGRNLKLPEQCPTHQVFNSNDGKGRQALKRNCRTALDNRDHARPPWKFLFHMTTLYAPGTISSVNLLKWGHRTANIIQLEYYGFNSFFVIVQTCITLLPDSSNYIKWKLLDFFFIKLLLLLYFGLFWVFVVGQAFP